MDAMDTTDGFIRPVDQVLNLAKPGNGMKQAVVVVHLNAESMKNLNMGTGGGSVVFI